MASFIKDIEDIRERARQKIEDGAVTERYELDKNRAVEILNEALATEIVCVLRYMHHYFMATGVHGRAVADEFKKHADDEREHADELAERIQQLGGKPDFNPASLLQRSVSQYIEGETLSDMIREDLVAERTVIDVYQQMIHFFGEKDPTTRRMLEHIKAEEEEHAAELSDFLFIVNPRSGETEGEDPGTHPLKTRAGEGQASSRTSRTQQRHEAAMRRPGGAERRGADFAGSEDADLNQPLAEPNRGPAPTAAPGRAKTRSLDVSPTPRAQGGETQPGGGRRENREEVDQTERWGNPPSKLPGVSGRPMNRRRSEDELDKGDVAKAPNAGASGGTNRSPRIHNKNRKSKRAA